MDISNFGLQIEYRDGRGVVKVGNFGFAELMDGEGSFYPKKASPEVLGQPTSNHSAFTTKNDVFSFSLLLWV